MGATCINFYPKRQNRGSMLVVLTVLMMLAMLVLLPLSVTVNFTADITQKTLFVQVRLFGIKVFEEKFLLVSGVPRFGECSTGRFFAAWRHRQRRCKGCACGQRATVFRRGFLPIQRVRLADNRRIVRRGNGIGVRFFSLQDTHSNMFFTAKCSVRQGEAYRQSCGGAGGTCKTGDRIWKINK